MENKLNTDVEETNDIEGTNSIEADAEKISEKTVGYDDDKPFYERDEEKYKSFYERVVEKSPCGFKCLEYLPLYIRLSTGYVFIKILPVL